MPWLRMKIICKQLLIVAHFVPCILSLAGNETTADGHQSDDPSSAAAERSRQADFLRVPCVSTVDCLIKDFRSYCQQEEDHRNGTCQCREGYARVIRKRCSRREDRPSPRTDDETFADPDLFPSWRPEIALPPVDTSGLFTNFSFNLNQDGFESYEPKSTYYHYSYGGILIIVIPIGYCYRRKRRLSAAETGFSYAQFPSSRSAEDGQSLPQCPEPPPKYTENPPTYEEVAKPGEGSSRIERTV